MGFRDSDFEHKVRTPKDPPPEPSEVEKAVTTTSATADAAKIERFKAEENIDKLVAMVLAQEDELQLLEKQSQIAGDDFLKQQNKLEEMIANGASLEDISAQQATLDAADQASLAITDLIAPAQEKLAQVNAALTNIQASTDALEFQEEAAAAAAVAAKELAAQTLLSSSFSGKLEGAAGRKRLLAAQQCFLLYNNHFFVKRHRQLLSSNYPTQTPAARAKRPADAKGRVKNMAYNGYSDGKLKGSINTSPGYYSKETESTKIILINDTVKSNDSTVVNKLKAKRKQDEFDKITPAEYAQLIPRLRLFKVNYKNSGDGKQAQEAVEFEFNNKIDVTDMSAVGKTFEGSIRGDGAGIKSFEWSYLGSDAFTATRDLKATLKLNFQSFHELQKPRTSGGKEYRYLDLVIQANCSEKAGGTDINGRPIYDPGCYEVLAEVGYMVPSKSTLNPHMLEAIRSSVEHLYLVMTDHSFEFEQDGTFSMTVNYRARLGSQLGSRKFNVLLPGGGSESTAAQKHINNLKENIANLKKAEKDSSVPDEDPAGATSTGDGEKTPKEEKQEELDDYVARQRMRFYNAIYSSLRNRKWIHGIQIPKEDEKKYLNYDQKIIKPAKGTAGVEQFEGLPTPLDDSNYIWFDMAGASKTWDDMYVTKGDAGTASGAATAAKTKQENQLERLKEQLESDPSEYVRFVYLGDIIACVRDWIMAEDEFALTEYEAGGWFGFKAEKTGTNATDAARAKYQGEASDASAQLKRVRETFQIIMGNIEIKDFQSKETRLVNMAHIPISLDNFLNFMTTNVVAKKRKVYQFSKFLNDLISSMVMQNLSTGCFGGLIASSVRTSMTMLEIPSETGFEPIAGGTGPHGNVFKKSKRGHLRCSVFNPQIIGTGPTDQEFFLNEMPPMVSGGKSLKKTFDYLMVNSFVTKPRLFGVWDPENFAKKNKGITTIDTIGDKARGIPHYTFGQNTGILKTVKFQKTDQEYLPEAKYEQEGSSAINQLAAVYDVTFEMLGTSRFQPGQYIYFDPLTMGLGHSYDNVGGERSYANLMGLGGYHLVIEVSCAISRGDFTTTLKTRWTTSGCHPVFDCPD